MRVTVPQQIRQPSQTIRLGQYQQQQTNNQISANKCYCSLCDQKVPPSQMSFIVLRILACNNCANEKMSLLDTAHPEARLTKEKIKLEKPKLLNDEMIDDNFLSTSNMNLPQNLEKLETQKKSETRNV